MWRGRGARSVAAMTTSSHLRRLRAVLLCGTASLCAMALLAAGGHAASNTKTFRFFAKDTSITVTKPDGTVQSPPTSEPQPGDVLHVNSLLFKGDRREHAKRWTGSTRLTCVFASAGEPDCESTVAIGGSLMVFRGAPGTLVAGTGRFEGATGRVLRVDEVPGGNDVVARVKLRR